MYEELFQDIKSVEAQPPIVPQGDYNAVVSAWTLETIETRDGDTREVIRITLTYQNNPGMFLSDGITPVDGQTAQYTIFLPTEADKTKPSEYGRGTMYDVSVRRLRRFFESCGVNLEACADLESALEQCKGATVVAQVGTRAGSDGIIYDFIRSIR